MLSQLRPDSTVKALTQVEAETVLLIFNGQPFPQIATTLSVSVFTVHERLKKVYLKLNARDRIGLLRQVLQTRSIEPERVLKALFK